MEHVPPERRAGQLFSRSERGFSLLEVLTATALMTAGLVAIAQLFLVAIDAVQWSGVTAMTTALASQKLEQLRSLAFFTDETGAPITDCTSDLSVSPPSPTGGRGLLASPASALSSNTPGYVDYLDAAGQWVATGATVPRDATFARRWSITTDPVHPNDALILQVVVVRSSATSQAASRRAGDAVLAGVKARRAR